MANFNWKREWRLNKDVLLGGGAVGLLAFFLVKRSDADLSFATERKALIDPLLSRASLATQGDIKVALIFVISFALAAYLIYNLILKRR